MGKLEVQGFDATQLGDEQEAEFDGADSDVTEDTDDSADDSASTATSGPEYSTEITALREQNALLSNQFAQLMDRLTPRQQAAAQKSAEELAEEFKTNPVSVIQHLIKGEFQGAKAEMTQEQQKAYWDNKASADYPAMQKDPAFQRELQKAFNELTADGEYSKTHPKVVYRAAERAAARYAGAGKQSSKGTRGMTGEAPSASSGGVNRRPKEDRQFDRLASMFQIKDKDAMRKSYDAHIKKLRGGK